MSIAFCNGLWVANEELTVSGSDRGFVFGDGVFTTIRVAAGVAENLDRHLARLHDHCKILRIQCPPMERDKIYQLIEKNRAQNGVWRLKIIITGKEVANFSLKERPHQTVLMTLVPYCRPVFKTFNLVTYPFPIGNPLARVKSLAYLDRLHVMDYAQRQGVQDALTKTAEGLILETAFSNIFWVDQGRFYTPCPSLFLLQGTFLAALEERIAFQKVKVEKIPDTASVYLCNAMMQVQPVDAVGNDTFQRNRQVEKMLESRKQA